MILMCFMQFGGPCLPTRLLSRKQRRVRSKRQDLFSWERLQKVMNLHATTLTGVCMYTYIYIYIYIYIWECPQIRNAPSSLFLVKKEKLGAFNYGTPILRHSHIYIYNYIYISTSWNMQVYVWWSMSEDEQVQTIFIILKKSEEPGSILSVGWWRAPPHTKVGIVSFWVVFAERLLLTGAQCGFDPKAVEKAMAAQHGWCRTSMD